MHIHYKRYYKLCRNSEKKYGLTSHMNLTNEE